MAKQRAAPKMTKKHLARAERERRQKQWIIIGTIVIAVAVIGLLIWGWVDDNFSSVATVNGEKITAAEFRSSVRMAYANIVNQAFASGQESTLLESFAVPETIGQQVLDSMVDDILVRQEVTQLQ